MYYPPWEVSKQSPTGTNPVRGGLSTAEVDLSSNQGSGFTWNIAIVTFKTPATHSSGPSFDIIILLL